MTSEGLQVQELKETYPRTTIPEGFRVVRVCIRGKGPWHFNFDGSGRFDLELPYGTCYVASDVIGALAESLGDCGVAAGGFRIVPLEDIEARCVRVLELPYDVSAANVRDPRSENFSAGVAGRSLAFERRRAVTQDFARRFHMAEFLGIVYETRRLAGAVSIALFGDAGEQKGRKWKRGRARSFRRSELCRAREELGFLIRPKVTAEELSAFVIG